MFGPPLVFTTPNVADPSHVVMRLLYEDAGVSEWRVLEEHAPEMPSKAEMLRRVAADPVSLAIFFDFMVRLFFKHVLGVDISRCSKCADGVSSEYGRGVFGVVRAFLAPVETQGRGGLHFHMHIWILHPMRALLLEKLRCGDVDAELERGLKRWREAVFEKVASMQFDCVEEVGRQLGLDKDVLGPVPFQERQQKQCFMDGSEEVDDVAALPRKGENPSDVIAQGPKRTRPFVAVQEDPELDPHQYQVNDGVAKLLTEGVARKRPQTRSCLSLCPQWRRKPRYRTLADGQAVMCQSESAEKDASNWKYAFGRDARKNMVRSSIHKCKNTCWKHCGAGDAAIH